ncbi:MAG: hypothetical protein ACXW31_08925 [Thermoanaerobaculia bacterium]
MQTITGIPAEAVGQVVQDFINDGAGHVVAERDENGLFTVSAT